MVQPGRRGRGQADNSDFSLAVPYFERCRLFQAQSSARCTKFARQALRFTYRQTV